MLQKTCSVLAMTLLVAGCGGSGGGGTTVYGGKISELVRISTAPEFSTLTPAASVPTTGDVTYTGVTGIVAETSATTELVAAGDTTIMVSFGTGTITGQVDNIVSNTSQPITGNLALSSTGVITGNLVPMQATGTLVQGTGLSTDITATGSPQFYGATAGSIFGLLTGTADTAGFTGAADAVVAVEQ